MTEDSPSFTPTRFAQSAPVHLHRPADSDPFLARRTSQRRAHPDGFFHPLIHVIFVLRLPRTHKLIRNGPVQSRVGGWYRMAVRRLSHRPVAVQKGI